MRASTTVLLGTGFRPGRQDNPSPLYFGIKRISGANIQPSTQRTGKNNLTFRGNRRPHGKTILPRADPQTKPARREESVTLGRLCWLSSHKNDQHSEDCSYYATVDTQGGAICR